MKDDPWQLSNVVSKNPQRRTVPNNGIHSIRGTQGVPGCARVDHALHNGVYGTRSASSS